MPPIVSSAEVQKLALDTAWSLWTELGASGGMRRHVDTGIDLEPLMLATAYLAERDARLRDESLDWCVTNYRFVSSDRLRNLVRASNDLTRLPFAKYAATVRRFRKVAWPGDGQGLDFSPTSRSTEPDLSRPALLQLRLRALFGVSARAEVLRWMLDQPDHFIGVLELATKAAYGKDNIADTLDLLAKAGVAVRTRTTSAGNTLVFRLEQEAPLVSSLRRWASVPQPRWDACFRVIVRLVDFYRGEREPDAARAANIHKLLRNLQTDLRWLGTYPALRQGVGAVNADFDSWVLGAMRRWAGLSTRPQNAVQH